MPGKPKKRPTGPCLRLQRSAECPKMTMELSLSPSTVQAQARMIPATLKAIAQDLLPLRHCRPEAERTGIVTRKPSLELTRMPEMTPVTEAPLEPRIGIVVPRTELGDAVAVAHAPDPPEDGMIGTEALPWVGMPKPTGTEETMMMIGPLDARQTVDNGTTVVIAMIMEELVVGTGLRVIEAGTALGREVLVGTRSDVRDQGKDARTWIVGRVRDLQVRSRPVRIRD